ncbi:epoxyqueuosine reductase [Sneathiella chinensis]|uniref:Epoxyqueuosine reductase n=1 Tax=Sneathiella chinensis TaxID=349750 RepID=A0ABQ5TYT5_9PROT|nr:epoxyqueuosine reductase [Sneathiella chinensis]
MISEPDKQALLDKAIVEGFDVARITSAAIGPAPGDRLSAFLEQGRQGDMDWLQTKADWRRHPQNLWPEARSVVMLGLNYGPEEDPRALADHPDKGIVSVYARGKDYHDVVKKRLKRIARWMVQTYGGDVKVFVDTAPVMEKPLAEAAGLGWQGKHTNLLSREFGSWLFLGCIFTTLEIAPDSPATGGCGQCTACLDACPTNAFPAPYQLDARRCISYLTIETRAHIPRPMRPLIGNRIYGCDDCLAACPWNKFAQTSKEMAFVSKDQLKAPLLADLVVLDDPAFRALFAGSPVKRLGRNRFIRNVLIALGNAGDPGVLSAVRPLLDDPSPIVRLATVWCLARLERRESFEQLYATRYTFEDDADVREEWEVGLTGFDRKEGANEQA